MLNRVYCTVSELVARLGGTFCGEKLVTGFALVKREVEFDPQSFSKDKLDQLIKEDKFMGKVSFYNVEDNDQEADFNTSVRKERSKTMPGTKGYKFTFDKGTAFQNELAKLDNNASYGFIPIFEDGSALFAVKKNGMLGGFACKLFVGNKKLQLTSEVAGSTLEVDIIPDAMIYWQKSSAVYESNEFSFNELEPVARLTIEAPVLTGSATTTKVKVKETYSGADIVGLTTADDWKMEEDGELKPISKVVYDATTKEYTLTHPALASRKKVRFITSNAGLRVISVDSNYYSGESEEQVVA